MPRATDRIIIDTNLWISYLLTKDSEFDRLLSDNLITLLFSQDLIDEFIEVARRPKFRKYFSASDLEALLVSISTKAIFIEILNTVDISPDPKDNFLLALARDGNATHLITGDKELLSLKKFSKTKIVTIRNYLSTK
jgi:putative PIN family toxin of toxin-antitoxin system